MKRFPIIAIATIAFAGLFSAQAADLQHLVPPSNPVPPEFFGMHIHHAGDTTPWPAVPIPAWRLWDAHVTWPDIEPKRGVWRFSLLDRYLSLGAAHDTSLLLPLGLSPKWASARPTEKAVFQAGSAAEPANMQDWRTYVTAVVRHCKGRVSAYEIWNEPNNKGFWTGDTDQMIALTREASAIIHSVDSQALVVSPAATMPTGVAWLTQFLARGGGKYVDVVGFHFYVAPLDPEAMVPLVREVRRAIAEAGVHDKPLWDTETGWQAPRPFPSDTLAAAYVARAFILAWAAGVQRFYWYAWDNHGWVSLQLTEPGNRMLAPAGHAFEGIQQWLSGAELKACDRIANGAWTCETVRSGSPGWILWSETAHATISIPPEWHAHTVVPLLGKVQAVEGPEIQLGPVPILVRE